MVLEKKKSTETASQTFIERIQDAIDRGLHDLTKAHEVISHDILLDKLNSYGKINLCFISSLTHRVQFVEINQI
jgi:hypothetical protein